MSLRERIDEFKLVIRAEALKHLKFRPELDFHTLILHLQMVNAQTIYYNYWVLWEMHDEGVITINEDLSIDFHSIY